MGPKLIARSESGRKAQSIGKYFEETFYQTCMCSGIAITRIPDSCKQVSATKLIRVKSPFDFILTHKGKSAFIDTKTLATGAFTHSKINIDQLQELEIHSKMGAKSGYIVWIRKIDKVIFINSDKLRTLLEMKCSLVMSTFSLGSITAFDPKKIFV